MENQILELSTIVKYNREQNYLKIPEKQLVDFIPCIVEGWPEEMKILTSWETFFQKKKIPYCIKRQMEFVNYRHRAVLSLWKKRY